MVGGDRLPVVRAIEDEPAAVVLPHEPGVGHLRGAARLADHEAHGGIIELVGQPEGLGLAIAGAGRGRHVRCGREVGAGEGLAEGPALVHQLADAVERVVFAAELGENLLYRGHVGVVRSGGSGQAEVEIDVAGVAE